MTLGALDVSSTPLRSISLASIALAGVPLRSIPLPGAGTTDAARIAAWCQLLSNLGSNCAAFGIDPNNPSTASAVDLLTLELGGVSIDSIPLRSIPLRSIDVTSSPLRSIPLRSIDINSTPLRSIPLRSINLSALPLGSFPLRSIPAGSPAVNCSVAGVDCSSTSTQTLADAAAAGAIPSSATLADLANLTSNESLGSITNLAAGPLGALPLRSIDLSSPTNGIAALPLRSIAVASTPLRSIPLRSIGSLSSVVNCSLVDCTATSTATLGSASDAGAILNTASLGQLADLDDAVLGGISLNSLQLATNPIGAVPLRSIDDLTSIVNCATVDCTATSAATLASAEQAGAILSSATLDQLGPYLGTALGQLGSYGNATLSDLGPFLGTLLGDLLTNLSGSDIDFYLGDVLLGLVPPTSYPWQDVNLSNLPVTSIGTGGGVVTYTSTVNLLDAISEPVQMSIALPAGLSYIPGSSRLDGQAISDPSGPLSWTETLTPGTHTLTVRAASAAALGPATATLTTTLAGRTPQSTTDTVNVVDGASGPDAAHAVTFFPNHLVLGYLNGPSDSDWWSVSVAPGSELALSLSNLPADYDMALFSPATVPLQSGPTTVSPGVTDSAPTVGGQSEAPPTSNDINAAAPSGYQLYAVSQNRGTADENIQTPPLAGGNYLVHVTSYGGAWSDSPYVLQATTLTGLNPSCSISYPNAAPAAGTLPSSYPSNVNTLFLVNTQRLTEAYGSSAEQSVMSDLSQVASDSGDGVVGAVVPVDGDAATQAAYGEWQANACSVDGANAVVAKISDLVDQIRADHPTITSVVIVGADDQIPFARLADGTGSRTNGTTAPPPSPARPTCWPAPFRRVTTSVTIRTSPPSQSVSVAPPCTPPGSHRSPGRDTGGDREHAHPLRQLSR